MLVIMIPALDRASFASFDANLKLRPKQFDILTCPAHGKMGRGIADIRAIHTGANALAHVHFFGQAGVCTRRTEQRTQHGVAGRHG
ncbi:hypothetical protein [Aurantimonas aggregata]|uniref:hypothetical protein n=1 Tax=Aurantimonas aggregata TaxID=2047720 RepID=UPI001FE9D710|nr:hypothetical protein [Aurantimonas aggregata]